MSAKAHYKNVKFYVFGKKCNDSEAEAVLDEVMKDGSIAGCEFNSNPDFLYDGLDLLVFPSRYDEGFPRVILEAWSRRVVVLARNAFYLDNIVDDGVNGFLYTGDELESKFLDVITAKKDRLKAVSDEAFEKCKKKFDVQFVIREYHRRVFD